MAVSKEIRLKDEEEKRKESRSGAVDFFGEKVNYQGEAIGEKYDDQARIEKDRIEDNVLVEEHGDGDELARKWRTERVDAKVVSGEEAVSDFDVADFIVGRGFVEGALDKEEIEDKEAGGDENIFYYF